MVKTISEVNAKLSTICYWEEVPLSVWGLEKTSPKSILLILMSNAHGIFTKFFYWESPMSLLLISWLSDPATLKGKSSGKCDLWRGRGGAVSCAHIKSERFLCTQKERKMNNRGQKALLAKIGIYLKIELGFAKTGFCNSFLSFKAVT